MVWRELVLEGKEKGMKWGTVMGGRVGGAARDSRFPSAPRAQNDSNARFGMTILSGVIDGAGKSFSYGGQNEDCG